METEQDVLTSQESNDAAQVEDKRLPQDEVNRIVGRVKAETAEKVRRQVEAEYAGRSAQSSATNKVDSQEIVEEVERRLREKLAKEHEESQQKQAEQEWNNVVNNYNNKLAQTARSKTYDDFDEVMKGIDHSKYDYVVWGASNLDNTGDIMYELAKNPTKASNLEMLGRHDQLAFEREMKKLSDSIKKNREAAKNVSKAPEPHSRLTSQVAGVDSNAISDYASLKARYTN